MHIIDRLSQASSSKMGLAQFVNETNNALELSDFFTSQSYLKLFESKGRIENYILPYFGIYIDLEFNSLNEISLISHLLDYSERFGLIGEFEQLYYLHERHNLEISSRLKAASKFLVGITNIGDYSTRIPDVLNLLKIAYTEEEDCPKPVIATLVNFYAQVMHNFSSQNITGVKDFLSNLTQQIKDASFSFLENEIYNIALEVDFKNNVAAYNKIQGILDDYLSRTNEPLPFNRHAFLIESETNYTDLLLGINTNFSSLRDLNSSLYQCIASDSIYYSLQRGVAVLKEQNQMLAYMYSYGNMHYAKMKSAIKDSKVLDNLKYSNIEIYDWGCGQGLASYIFCELYQINSAKITLIEPSEICLKRASAHLRSINPETEIITINKDLDSLSKEDFNSKNQSLKVHLFSNILDVEGFSMEHLLQLINNSFNGSNIFICVSPYINIARTNRLNIFMKSFSEKVVFQKLLEIDNISGAWERNWSRSIRVFKTQLNTNNTQ